MKRRATSVVVFSLLVALALGAAPSCAYFNTLYNARKKYQEAEKATEISGSDREQREKYKEVVKKCAQLIQDYPRSRWVDDAVFLMGQALIRQGEYDKGIRKFQEILTNFPESDYVPKSLYWLALGYYEREEYNQALAQTDRFLKEYPNHDFRHRVMFLAGDIKRALEDDEGALALYERVAEESSKREITDEARLKSAELFRAQGAWEKAAASYEKLLQKGISWEDRLAMSLALGDCYNRMGKNREALVLFDELLAKATSTQEIPPLLLGRGASFAGMKDLDAAFKAYDEVTTKYPKSIYSAEAFYRKGVIYEETLDSLRLAQEAFSRVAGEYADSEHASAALEKSSSMKRLIELQKSPGAEETAEQAAEKRFLAAEIQLTKLGSTAVALTGYEAILDSFPGTAAAPRAAYAIAWIRQFKLDEKDAARDRYRDLIRRYPRSPQAKGAILQFGVLGGDEGIKGQLQAYMDSALADTTALPKAAPPVSLPSDSTGAKAGVAPSTPADSIPASPGGASPDSLAAPRRNPPRLPPRAGFPNSLRKPPAGGAAALPDTLVRPGEAASAPADTSIRPKGGAAPDTSSGGAKKEVG